jgi:hypothetical protein
MQAVNTANAAQANVIGNHLNLWVMKIPVVLFF